MNKQTVGWAGVVILAVVCCYDRISNTQLHSKLSLHDLLLMVPQWCEMTDFVGGSYVELSQIHSLGVCAAAVVLLFVCWCRVEEDEVEVVTQRTTELEHDVQADEVREELAGDVLWESAKALLDQVDLEFSHCSAAIASNNQTPAPGRAGGEAEWASGETSSEEDDATLEITGAHVKRHFKETEDKQLEMFNNK